jgi:putative nucleotidyltransferase with HDIG domain
VAGHGACPLARGVGVALDQESLQKFRAEVLARRNLPTLPPVLARVLALVDAQETNARQLVEVIERDQALTGKILRLANSAFFGQSRRVATIPRAILLLGFSSVRSLTLGIKVWDALAVGVAPARLEELWQHAVAVALAAKVLATRLLEGDPDEAFTAGLLHDVGRPLMAARLREAYWRAIDQANGQPLDAVERAAFGVDHAEVGGWLLEAWNLPPPIVEAARLHHSDAATEGVSWLVAVGNRLVNATDLASRTMRPEAAAVIATVANRGITAELWEAVIPELASARSLGNARGA